ncbi:hypothetical protein, partial [Crocosphaera sp.]|uniref:hypothetical protein n=1 Tax=Crocosphaera sp. TaxID=2729996 RepID=UPI00257E0237
SYSSRQGFAGHFSVASCLLPVPLKYNLCVLTSLSIAIKWWIRLQIKTAPNPPSEVPNNS